MQKQTLAYLEAVSSPSRDPACPPASQAASQPASHPLHAHGLLSHKDNAATDAYTHPKLPRT